MKGVGRGKLVNEAEVSVVAAVCIRLTDRVGASSVVLVAVLEAVLAKYGVEKFISRRMLHRLPREWDMGFRRGSIAPVLLAGLTDVDELRAALGCRFALDVFTVAQQDHPLVDQDSLICGLGPAFWR